MIRLLDQHFHRHRRHIGEGKGHFHARRRPRHLDVGIEGKKAGNTHG